KEYITKEGVEDDIQLNKALAMFLESKKGTPNEPNLPAHVRSLTTILGASTYLHQLKTPDITRLVTQLKKKFSNSTIKHRLQTLRSTINLADDHGFMVPKDLKYPRLKTKRGRTRVLSAEELQSIENELHPDKDYSTWHMSDEAKKFRQDAYDMFILLCSTGARYTEISKIEWQQINVRQGSIHLYRSKVDNESILVLTEKAREVIKRRSRNRLSRKYVFPNKKGEARGYNGSCIKKAIKRAGLGPEVTPHVIRHTVATRLLEGGMSIVAVRDILGHASTQTTERYLHTSTQNAAIEAANILNQKIDVPMLNVVHK
ncbi:MAG: site-specific integrase, partial [SAR324 cluster bacterium]|nr:site-specific integrase [SAR324 cluster bacterium]